MIQRIIKDPKAKDNMLLKLLKQNSYATSKSIANKITKEKEREFIKEQKVSKSIAKAKEASMRVEEVIKEESKRNYLMNNMHCNESNTQIGYLDNKQFKTQINGKNGGDMILEYIISHSPQLAQADTAFSPENNIKSNESNTQQTENSVD